MRQPADSEAAAPSPAAERCTPATAEPPQAGQPYAQRLGYLDGIRALAVAAVVLYHAGISWIGGGLLGVDVFFVLSGFLITSILCTEFSTSASIRLRSFYAHRARRLLPALLILLLGVSAYAYVFSATADVASIRADAFSTLFYFSNWHFVLAGQGYFAPSASLSPLLHTWSLAVEEQYYLVWPPVALLVLRRWGTRSLAVVALVGALASAALMAGLYHLGVSTDRLYYGTDTRAQALLVGSFLGVVGSSRSWRVFDPTWARTRGRATGWILGAVGCLGLAWAWHGLGGQDPFLYDGGFLLVALFAGAVVTTVMSWPTSVLARCLSLRPLVFLGRISYGVYLYHWPLFLVISPAHTGLTGAALAAVRLLVTLAAASISWRFVEEPIRQGRWLRSWRAGAAAGAATLATAAALFLATVAPAAAALPPPRGRSALTASEVQSLKAIHAFGPDPIRFVLAGDSVAWTAAVGLKVGARHDYGVNVINGGVLGCSLVGTTTRIEGVVSQSTDCYTWQRVWPGAIAKYRPQVVGILIGRFELATFLHDGTWVHVGEQRWDAVLERRLREAIRVVSSRGARVALFTYPYIDPPTVQLDGEPWPESEPSRVDAWNRLLRQTAARFPHVVTLIDLNRVLDPKRHYSGTVDGVQVRWSDGIHITRAGGEWLQPRILPEVASLGLEELAHRRG